MRKLKILICELLLILSFVGLCGFYALIIWRKNIKKPPAEGWVTIQGDAKETVYRGRWHKDGRWEAIK